VIYDVIPHEQNQPQEFALSNYCMGKMNMPLHIHEFYHPMKGEVTMRTIKNYMMMMVVIGISILLTLPTYIYAGVFNDAYSYEDAFEDDTGLNLAETNGFTIDSGGGLLAETDPATAISQCITLPQPDGGAFLEWSFLDISLAGVGGAANSLEVQDCSGGPLLTVNNLPDGETSLDRGCGNSAAMER